MAPRTKRSTLEQKQSDLPPLPLLVSSNTFCDSWSNDFEPILEEEVAPFLQDDWWTSSTLVAEVDHSQFLDVVDPFLHYPEESQGPSSATPASAAISAPRWKEKGSPLGVNTNRRRESHVLSERQRRKGMNHLFATLAALLPENTPKGNKSTIISQIIQHIQSLQGELEELSKKRDLRPKREEIRMDCATQSCPTTSAGNNATMDSSLAPNVVFSICGHDAFVTMSADSSHNLLAQALTILQQHRLTVLDGHISSSDFKKFYYFHAKVPNGLQVSRDLVQTALQSLARKTVTSSPSALVST